MKLTYTVADLAYSATSIAEFLAMSKTLQGSTFSDMSQAIFALYPSIEEGEIRLLAQTEIQEYCVNRLRFIYRENKPEFDSKMTTYQKIWDQHSKIIEDALGDIFQVDTCSQFNSMKARITLCPICPRFLNESIFDLFYQYSAEGSLYVAMHEIMHFVWFTVWNRLFHDSPDLYEQPHLPWIFSELAIDAIMMDQRLHGLIFNEHQAQYPAYPEFYDIYTDKGPLVHVFRKMYGLLSISDFMAEGYTFLKENASLFAPFFG